jgi:hypothetical protein
LIQDRIIQENIEQQFCRHIHIPAQVAQLVFRIIVGDGAEETPEGGEVVHDARMDCGERGYKAGSPASGDAACKNRDWPPIAPSFSDRCATATITFMAMLTALIEMVASWIRDVILSVLGRHAEEFVTGRLARRHQKQHPKRRPIRKHRKPRQKKPEKKIP